MLFQHVAIAGLAHIDAPRRLTSDEIHARLRPTLDRLGIKSNILQDVAGVSERRLWDGEMKASDAATLAGVKALADAGIDADRIGLLVNTPSAATTWSRPRPASSRATCAWATSARTSTSPTPAWRSSTAWTSPAG